MNFDKEGEAIAKIVENKNIKNQKIYISDHQPDDNKYFSELGLEDGKFQLIPIIRKGSRHTNIYVCGQNGSGKSYWIADYIKQVLLVDPDIDIYLFSSKNEDDNLDVFPQIKRITIDQSFIDNPMNYEALENSLVLFDDVDALEPKLKKPIYHLVNIILKNGRSYNINVIVTMHHCTGSDVKCIIGESNVIVFFLRNYNRYLKYLLTNYAGLDDKQIKVLRKNQSRATCYIKSYPNTILQEKNMYIINNMDE